jgi:MYXO-CTERM domain-containing protein
MFITRFAIAVAAILLAFAPAAAHHGHNHRGQGHQHDGTPGGTIPAFNAPGHCKHHPHGCGTTAASVAASEPFTLLVVGAGLVGAAALRRRMR